MKKKNYRDQNQNSAYLQGLKSLLNHVFILHVEQKKIIFLRGRVDMASLTMSTNNVGF